ncbi:MAG: GntR family transcriptional regulator [Ilumatobacteraceae bacterium]|nr:GntR family transcriptional regulator [Ilumatobacteraceae bacterium]
MIRSAHELVHSIERDVRSGRLQPGEKLPSVRSLATSTGLSPSTVAAALAELRRRGVVVSRERSGTVVAPPIGPGPLPPYVSAGAMDLLHGGPDPALLPDLAAAVRAVADATSDAPRRDPYLADAMEPGLERWWRAHLPAPGAVAVTSGAFDAVERTLAANLRHGDRVGVEDPGYPPIHHVLRALGLVAVPMPVDDEGPTPAALRAVLAAGVSAVIITPKAQNPTGAMLTDLRADALRRILRTHRDTLLIEDDHLGLLGPSAPSLGGSTDRWIVARSVSKALGPDLRIALVVGDDDTVRAISSRLRAGPGWVSHLLQATASALLHAPGTVRVLAEAERTYDRRRLELLAALAARGVEAHGASGLCVWVPVRDETSVCLALADAGYAVAPGAPFRLGSGPAVRITTSRLDGADVDALADAVAIAVG